MLYKDIPNPTAHAATKTLSIDLKSLLDVFDGNKYQAKSRFRFADILLCLQRVSFARRAIQVLQSGDAHYQDRNGQTRRQSLKTEVCSLAAGTPLSSRPMGHRSSRLFRTIAGLRYLFFQHPSQPPVRAGFLSKEAPDDQNHEAQAEGQHPPPGPLLLPSEGVLHCPAKRDGFAGGKLKGAVRVNLFLTLGRGLGTSPATGRRMQASERPAHEPQYPEGPGRERTVSAPARRSHPRSRRDRADLTQQPAPTARSSSRPRLRTRRRRAQRRVTSVARSRKPRAVPGLRSRLQNVDPLAQRK